MNNYIRLPVLCLMVLVAIIPTVYAQQSKSPRRINSGRNTAETGPYAGKPNLSEMQSLNIEAEGNYKRNHGDIPGGIALLQKALRVEPGNDNVYLDLAQAYAQQHDWQNSVKSYRVIMYDWPGKNWSNSIANEYDHLLDFTVALQNAGLQSEAQTVYLKAMHFAPDRVRPLLYVPDDLHTFSKAKMNASLHVALSEWYAWKSHTVGKEEGRVLIQQSIAEAETAVATAPRYAPAHKILGDALAYQSVVYAVQKRNDLVDGMRARAVDAYKRAAALDTGEVGAAAKKEIGSYWLHDSPKLSRTAGQDTAQ